MGCRCVEGGHRLITMKTEHNENIIFCSSRLIEGVKGVLFLCDDLQAKVRRDVHFAAHSIDVERSNGPSAEDVFRYSHDLELGETLTPAERGVRRKEVPPGHSLHPPRYSALCAERCKNQMRVQHAEELGEANTPADEGGTGGGSTTRAFASPLLTLSTLR